MSLIRKHDGVQESSTDVRQDEDLLRVNATYRAKIQSIAESRDVAFLMHFTQTTNLVGIVKHGILSRRILAGPKYLAYASDKYRMDENEDAVSVSISRVNKAMLALKRHKSGHSDWVVLILSSEILWTHNCQFCWSSAAKSEIKSHRGWRGGPWAFAKMFAGSDDVRSGLPRCCPTDAEAEVQVLEHIEPRYILGAIVDQPIIVERVQTTLNGLQGGPRPVVVDTFDLSGNGGPFS